MTESGFKIGEENKWSMAFQHKEYLFRRRMLGYELHVYDNNSNVVFYLRQKPFSLRKDFRVYADESMRQELLVIKIPIFTFLIATYNIEDPTTGKEIGSITRRVWKGTYSQKDEWIFSLRTGKK